MRHLNLKKQLFFPFVRYLIALWCRHNWCG